MSGAAGAGHSPAFDLVMNGHLSKPIDVKLLKKALRQFILGEENTD